MSQTPWSPPEGIDEADSPDADASPDVHDGPVIEITDLWIERPSAEHSVDESGGTTPPVSRPELVVSPPEIEEEADSEEGVPHLEDLDSNWVTVGRAARLLDVSESTVRRRLAAGTLNGELAYDPAIGTKRWMIHTSELPDDDSRAGTLVPIEAIDRLEAAWEALREATGRAERAERIAEFEKNRRAEAERERDRLRSLLTAENQLADRVAKLERDKRQQVEKERDRLRAMLEAEKPATKSRWQAITDSLLDR